jgi:spore germination protein Q
MSNYNPYENYYRQQQQPGMGVPQAMQYTQQAPGMGAAPLADIGAPGQLPIEQSYIENILRLNKGKVATVYMTFENNEKWNAKVFKGIIEAAGRDHIILSDPQTGKRYLLLMVYVNYITFDEEINYFYPYNGTQQQQQTGQLATYSPR